MWESGYTGNLAGSDTAVAFQYALRIDPASSAFGLAYSGWRPQQQIILAAPALSYLPLRHEAGNILQRADAQRSAHKQQKRRGYRNYLAAAASQAPHREQNNRSS